MVNVSEQVSNVIDINQRLVKNLNFVKDGFVLLDNLFGVMIFVISFLIFYWIIPSKKVAFLIGFIMSFTLCINGLCPVILPIIMGVVFVLSITFDFGDSLLSEEEYPSISDLTKYSEDKNEWFNDIFDDDWDVDLEDEVKTYEPRIRESKIVYYENDGIRRRKKVD